MKEVSTLIFFKVFVINDRLWTGREIELSVCLDILGYLAMSEDVCWKLIVNKPVLVAWLELIFFVVYKQTSSSCLINAYFLCSLVWSPFAFFSRKMWRQSTLSCNMSRNYTGFCRVEVMKELFFSFFKKILCLLCHIMHIILVNWNVCPCRFLFELFQLAFQTWGGLVLKVTTTFLWWICWARVLKICLTFVVVNYLWRLY